MRTIQIYLSDLKELLGAREFAPVRATLKTLSPVDLADGWEHFTPEERRVLFKLSPRQRALQLFEELDPAQQQELLEALRAEELEELVEDLDPTETGRILRELPKPLVRQLEGILRKGEHGEKVERYLQYPDDSVGSLMRSNFVSLAPDWTAHRALEHIHNGTKLRQIETMFLDVLFVVDADGMLKGTVTLKELVVAPSSLQVRELMNTDPELLDPELDQEAAANVFGRYKLECAPVVDRAHKILGVVLDQDIVEVVEEETEEDFAKMAGTRAEAFETAGPWRAAWHRLPWIGLTCVGQLVVAGVIRGFEVTVSQLVALVTFLPLIAALGGNVGSQSAIIMVREMSDGEVDLRRGRRLVLRDFAVGLLLGLAAAAVMTAAALALYGVRFGLGFALVTGIGTLTSMSVAAMLGAAAPLVFRRIGVDPATATGPLVTTLTDLLSITTYLGLGSLLLAGG